MRSLLYIVILLAVSGCGYSGSQTVALDKASRLMHTDPAAALSTLNSIDASELPDSTAMAQWALLYSEAMVVNGLCAPTDTIVNIAIDYYGRHNLADEFKKASRLKALMLSSGNSDALSTALYLQKEKEFMLYKERTARQRILYASLFALLVAAGIIIWMRQRIRIQSLRNETLMAEASGFKYQIEASRGDVSRLQTKLRGLLDRRFSLIDSLCQTYYESQGTKSERKAIADKVRHEIGSVRTDAFHEMEQAVNDCRDNLLARARNIHTSLSDEDYRLLVYLASGLSARSISLLLGESVDVAYKRKSRLKSRMKETVAPLCPEIMTIF